MRKDKIVIIDIIMIMMDIMLNILITDINNNCVRSIWIIVSNTLLLIGLLFSNDNI